MIIFGTRRTVTQLAVVLLVCGLCHRQAAQSVLEVVTKFTLFFIPLFPIRRRHIVQCTACGATGQISWEQAEQYRRGPGPAPGQPYPGPPPGPPHPPYPGPSAR